MDSHLPFSEQDFHTQRFSLQFQQPSYFSLTRIFSEELSPRLNRAKLLATLSFDLSSYLKDETTTRFCSNIGETEIQTLREFRSNNASVRSIPKSLLSAIKILADASSPGTVFELNSQPTIDSRWNSLFSDQKTTKHLAQEFTKSQSDIAYSASMKLDEILVEEGVFKTRTIKPEGKPYKNWTKRLGTVTKSVDRFLKYTPSPGWACGAFCMDETLDSFTGSKTLEYHAHVLRTDPNDFRADLLTLVAENISASLGLGNCHCIGVTPHLGMAALLSASITQRHSLQVDFPDFVYGWCPFATLAWAMRSTHDNIVLFGIQQFPSVEVLRVYRS